jgi:pyruvate carboxylase subunit B
MLEEVYRQLAAHNASGHIAEVLDEANRVRLELGYPPLVAPIRQLIATQAVYNVIGGDRYATVTQELKDYLQGLYGRPPVPADPELRRLVLGREEPITIRPADLLEPQVEAARLQLKKMSFEPDDGSVLIHLLFPNLAPEYLRGPGPTAKAPSRPLAAPVSPQPTAPTANAPAAPPAPAPAPLSAEFEVEVEGEVFKVRVSGAGMTVVPGAGVASSSVAPPPPRTGEGTVIAPMQGLIVKIPVKAGDEVKLGDVVAVLEAMKMQNDIVTTTAGRVREVYVKEGDIVTPSQPLLAVG